MQRSLIKKLLFFVSLSLSLSTTPNQTVFLSLLYLCVFCALTVTASASLSCAPSESAEIDETKPRGFESETTSHRGGLSKSMEVLVGGPTAFGLFAESSGEGSGPGSRIGAPGDASSDVSSSIGTPSDEENDSSFNSDEAESKFRGASLASMDSLEDSLPIKRGLSSHFSGKSKSFASLADVCTVNDLKKNENPLNKKRRLLIASKWAKKSFYSIANPKSMPLLALQETDDSLAENDDDDEERERERHRQDRGGLGLQKFHDKRLKSFKTRCFSLADLQEEHSELEDDDDHHHDF